MFLMVLTTRSTSSYKTTSFIKLTGLTQFKSISYTNKSKFYKTKLSLFGDNSYLGIIPILAAEITKVIEFLRSFPTATIIKTQHFPRQIHKAKNVWRAQMGKQWKSVCK